MSSVEGGVGRGTLYFVVGKPAKLAARSTEGKLMSQNVPTTHFHRTAFLGELFSRHQVAKCSSELLKPLPDKLTDGRPTIDRFLLRGIQRAVISSCCALTLIAIVLFRIVSVTSRVNCGCVSNKWASNKPCVLKQEDDPKMP